MSNDFYDISAKMKKLFPPNPEADRAAILEMAGSPVKEDITVDHINETVSVKKGSMPIDLDLKSFTRLAGINETQKMGPAGQAKGKDPMPSTSTPSSSGEQDHPLKDKLVGDSIDNDDNELEGISIKPRVPQEPMNLESQVASLTARISKIERALASAVSEGDGRKKGIHPTGHPKRKAQQAAIHAGESSSKKSIKEELFKKLAESKK